MSIPLAPDENEPSVLATLHTLVHDVLPACALAFGLMAIIWLACTIVTISGAVLGSWIILGTRGLIRTVAHLDRYRRRDPQPTRPTTEHTNRDEAGTDDEPA